MAQRAGERQIAVPSRAFAQWLLLALVLLMAIEVTLAFWLARHRRVQSLALVMKPRIQA